MSQNPIQNRFSPKAGAVFYLDLAPRKNIWISSNLTLRMAGPDGDFNTGDTGDDLTARIKGSTDSKPLLRFDF